MLTVCCQALSGMSQKTQTIMYREGWDYCVDGILSCFPFPKPSHLPLLVNYLHSPLVRSSLCYKVQIIGVADALWLAGLMSIFVIDNFPVKVNIIIEIYYLNFQFSVAGLTGGGHPNFLGCKITHTHAHNPLISNLFLFVALCWLLCGRVPSS